MASFHGLQTDHHISGCYHLCEHGRRYLPQVALESHTTINPISFSTQLKQTFSNPSSKTLSKVRYTFPLYDGVAVCDYTITYADETLRGVVKQKHVAENIFQAAVDRGESAGLLEALPTGVFGVTLANIPPREDLTVKISYCGELKHDSQIDGLRFTIPTSIAPRYGNYPGEVLQSNVQSKAGIRITVDIDMPGSAIRKVQSPSHPLAVTVGELSKPETSGAANGSPLLSTSQASATLALGSSELQDDFVLQILVDKSNEPRAVIETHATLPEQRAILATLVPKFALEQTNPEIVFIADQSGSMSGSRNQALVAALKVFLKSLPLGVRFNICAFGSRHQFLWPKSLSYSEANLKAAIAFVDTFAAAYGGTEMFEPIQQAFERHLKDLPLEVILLTDGEIWREDEIFDFINSQIRDNKVDARVFALGIGQQVSHTLVEGVARAGNGFAQFAQTELEIDQKVVRMLKGALYAHTKDYSLEVHYNKSDATPDDSDFVIVDMAHDHLVSNEELEESATSSPAKPKSFFDPSAEVDNITAPPKRYAHLPAILPPAILQAPAIIPPLYPFNRTNIYVLLGADSPQKVVSSITIRATSHEGPLELNIPVYATKSGTSIHQLAARKAIQDLEEGRGWLQSATTKDRAEMKEISLKEKYESRFDEIVEREAVRLGERFSVAAKFTSFVAVSDKTHEELQDSQANVTSASPVQFGHPNPGMMKTAASTYSSIGPYPRKSTLGGLMSMPAPPAPGQGPSYNMNTAAPSDFGPDIHVSYSRSAAISTAQNFAMRVEPAEMDEEEDKGHDADAMANLGSAPRQNMSNPVFALRHSTAWGSVATAANTGSSDSPIHKIIALQTFAGAWQWDKEMLHLVGKDESKIDIANLGGDKDVVATVLAIAYLETVLREKKDVWEMIVSKARIWLGKQMSASEERIEELIRTAAETF